MLLETINRKEKICLSGDCAFKLCLLSPFLSISRVEIVATVISVATDGMTSRL